MGIDKTNSGVLPLITIDKTLGHFGEFLNLEGNKRIFFSGRFGSGKTSFLREFFRKDGLYGKSYNAYFLFPIRYQILNNYDVLDFMRYDLLTEIYKNHWGVFEKAEVEKADGKFKVFLKSINRPERIVEIVTILSKLGRSTEVISNLVEKLREFKEDTDNSENKALVDLGSRVDSIINADLDLSLEEILAAAKSDKKDVLVVDDLDRLDPNHIFRILNILSAHIDPRSDANLFNFDHIVVVGHKENIKHVFKHRYGPEADFDGYFDKFFTIKPYGFDIREDIRKWVDEVFYEFIANHPKNEDLKDALIGSGYIKLTFESLIRQLIDAGEITARRITKLAHYSYAALNEIPVTGDWMDVSVRQKALVTRAIQAMTLLFDGNKQSLIDAITRIRVELPETKIKDNSRYYEDMIYAFCATLKNHRRPRNRPKIGQL